MKKMRHTTGIRTRLTLTHVITAFVSVVILMLIVRFTIIKEFESYVREDQSQIMKSLVTQADASYDGEGNLLPSESLKQLGTLALERGIVLQFKDPHGKLLWCMHCEDESSCSLILNSVKANTASLCHDMTATYVETEYPVMRNGLQVGNVVTGSYSPFYYTDREAAFLKKTQWGFVISFLIATVIAAGMGILVSGIFSKPIRKVVEQTERISRKEYDRRVDTGSSVREVGELAESVNRLTEHLAHAEHTRARLAGAYAHEFRTPLSSLELTLQAMVDGVCEASPERLASCEEEVQRLIGMLKNIEKLVEAEDNSRDLNLEMVDVDRLVRSVLGSFDRQAEEKIQTVQFSSTGLQVLADQEKLRQVLSNLLSNAMKYTGNNKSIYIQAYKEADRLYVQVEDQGMGIGAEDLPYIFDYFYRAEQSRARETGGSGIGLAIVKAMVEAHGGEISVESTLDSGSRFTFWIPDVPSS